MVTVERRKNMTDMTDIAAMIADEPDPKLRAVLAVISELFGRLESKLDAALEDESTLRKLVLNGHADNFHDNMQWVTDRRLARCEEVCTWGRSRMDDEVKDADAERKMKFGIKEQVIAGLITALALSWLPKFFGG